MIQADSILKDLLQGMAPAAEFLRASRADFQLSQVEHKGKNDLVSHVDRKTEALLVAACREVLPEAGFIREEGDAEGSDQPWRWIIDPLDGTTNFVHDFPAWCMSVALQHKEQTVLGVVWDVPRNEVFSAVRGQGAWRNGQPIQVSAPERLQDSMLGMGFPYAGFDRLSDYMAVAQRFLESSHGLRRMGAAALDLAWVACGRLDGFYEIGLKAWDVAAGALLVQEAGGNVSDFRGTDNFVFGRNIAASNGNIHAEMLNVINEKF